MTNDHKVVRSFWNEASRQPVEQGVVPDQAHGGGADDEQGPVLRVACRHTDSLRHCTSTVTVWYSSLGTAGGWKCLELRSGDWGRINVVLLPYH